MPELMTVTQFNDKVLAVISSSREIRNVTMVAEISSITRAASGHYYLDLKDSQSNIRCTFFRYAASKLIFDPKPGMKVLVFGGASFYPKGGSLSFNIEWMKPYGKGEASAALEELTARLLKEGLFDAERKRALPVYPRAIGVVTSPSGAVIKDIIDTVAKRFPSGIILAAAKVQGEGAPESLVAGIELLNSQEDVDVIIVGRGGGSAEDLSAFNSETVVRAIASSKVPVVSAVGHATDKSLSDRVADAYAETPTMAAVMCTRDIDDIRRGLSFMTGKIARSLTSIVKDMRSRFAYPNARLDPRNAAVTLERYGAKLDLLSERGASSVSGRLRFMSSRYEVLNAKLDPKRAAEKVEGYWVALDSVSEAMDDSVVRRLADNSRELEHRSQMLAGLDPRRVLDRGYSFVTDEAGRTVTSVSGLRAGSKMTVTMRDGFVKAEVEEVTEHGRREE
ncbi:MAG: exodeoxyribonuclease VII large subunit [Candidatus Methanomethylophilaceae archaeon]